MTIFLEVSEIEFVRERQRSKAIIWPVLRDIWQTVRNLMQISIIHWYEVAYELSIGTKISDIEWPWTA